MLGFDDIGGDSTQESSPYEESNDFSEDVFANKPRKRRKKRKEKKAELVVVRVSIASEVVFKQGSVINQKMSAQQIQNQHQ